MYIHACVDALYISVAQSVLMVYCMKSLGKQQEEFEEDQQAYEPTVSISTYTNH